VVEGVREDKSLHCLVEKTRLKDDPEYITVQKEDVVVNLGLNPPMGTVYGNSVEPYYGSKESDWGSIHFFRDFDKKEKTLMKKALSTCYSDLEKRALTAFLPINIEIRHPKGNYAGMYRYTSKENVRDLMVLRPAGFDDTYLREIIYHESAHGIWYVMVPKKLKARWIKSYQDYVVLSKATVKQMRDIGKELEQAGSIKDFRTGLSEEEDTLLSACLGFVYDTYFLTKDNLDVLLSCSQSIKEYWPRQPMDLPDIETPIGEYAGKNVEEFFAEAFRIHLIGKGLPSHLEKLIKTTLSYCTS